MVVESIRRDEFGIGLALSAAGRALVDRQNARLGRALQRLSVDLYRKDSHFVLELIQNADDNAYADAALPTLGFVVAPTQIRVVNNEVGFRAKDVRALCDVGRSTKAASHSGYIGQKGIGFKSVFRVSDTPEVHSAGFHFRFDATQGNMGYILPHWLDEQAAPAVELSPAVTRLPPAELCTTIALPLKPSIDAAALMHSLHALHPSLLLFLHRIRRLFVHDAAENATTVMERENRPDGVVLVRSNAEEAVWLLVTETLTPPPEVLRDGAGVGATDISLAFPLAEEAAEGDASSGAPPPLQPVFAYLPLRSYGFRFLLNADWIVPSSREDVTENCVWNEWLRAQVPGLFLEALRRLRRRYESAAGAGDAAALAGRVLRFLPLEGEVVGWFRHAAAQIGLAVRNSECLVSSEGTWTLPCQTLACADDEILDLIPAALLRDTLGCTYLHPALLAQLPRGVLATLHVDTVQPSHLLAVGTALARAPTPAVSDEWLARWLVLCVARAE
eukprot:EG_transcript_9602